MDMKICNHDYSTTCLVGIVTCSLYPDGQYTGHPHCWVCSKCGRYLPYHEKSADPDQLLKEIAKLMAPYLTARMEWEVDHPSFLDKAKECGIIGEGPDCLLQIKPSPE